MAELADALDLGSSGATRASSILVISTKKTNNVDNTNVLSIFCWWAFRIYVF